MLEQNHRKLNDEPILEFRKILNRTIYEWEQKVDLALDSTESEFKHLRGACDDQYSLIGEVNKLSSQMSIIALYRTVELHTKDVIRWHFPSIDTSGFYNLKSMKKSLSSHGLQLDTINSYSDFDELRALNNAIKHNGFASDELEKYGWVLGESLDNLDAAFERLVPKINEYIDDLACKIAQCSARKDA